MAIKVTKNMLKYDYSWQAVAGDDPKAIRIDATLFNRNEGYEVVPMIQDVVNHFGFESEADVQRVEQLIRDDLPGNIRDKKKVYAWLIERLN